MARRPPAPGTGLVLGAMALAALVLVGTAAAVAAATRSGTAATAADDPPVTGPALPAPVEREGVALRMSFGGVVLERHAVGVTAAYPRLSLTAEGPDGPAVASLRLPTFNCLTTEAPPDPVAAGCTPAGTEHARLSTPALELEATGGTLADGLRGAGRFTTRSDGADPQPTGRSYELRVTAVPQEDGGTTGSGWVPATGELRIGEQSATSAGGAGEDVLRRGG